MKTILSAALVLGLCGLAGARDAKADPVGTWKCEYEIGGQKRMSTLTIKKDGDKLAGTMSWPDQKDVKLMSVKMKDGNLIFTAEREFMDNKFMIDYNLKIDGAGKGQTVVGGNDFHGIGISNADVVIDAVTVTGVRDNPLNGAQRGRAILART